eukprot:COSAG02_NODE_366_length_23740_cov_20.235904_14_plen_137_part_00
MAAPDHALHMVAHDHALRMVAPDYVLRMVAPDHALRMVAPAATAWQLATDYRDVTVTAALKAALLKEGRGVGKPGAKQVFPQARPISAHWCRTYKVEAGDINYMPSEDDQPDEERVVLRRTDVAHPRAFSATPRFS